MATQDKDLYPKASDIVFAESCSSTKQIGINGGVISGNPVTKNGYTAFDGTDDKITYNQPVYGIKSVSFDLYVGTTTEQVMEFNTSQSIIVSAGTLTATNWTAATIYLNGMVSAVVAATTWYRVTITTATAFNGTAISLGNISTGFGNIRLKNLSFSKSSRAAQEALDDYKGSTYNYEGKAVLNLPMHDKIGSAVPYTTSDLSGNGYNATLGDGSTSTTFPTKLGHRNGFTYDSGDYLTVGDKTKLNFSSAFTLLGWIRPTGSAECGWISKFVVGIHYLLYQSINTRIQRIYIVQASGTSSALETIGPPLNQWTMVTATFDKSLSAARLKICLNDYKGLGTSDAYNEDITSAAGDPFLIGKYASNFTGDIGWVKAWDFALTQTQIRNEYFKGSKYLGV
jgi:hypothetical protein